MELQITQRALRAVLAIAFLLPATSAMASLELARQKTCLACHAVDKTLLGPSYQDVAARYLGRADAATVLAGKLLKGGGGAWGPTPMPPQAINEAEAARLVAWVLSLPPSAKQPPAQSASLAQAAAVSPVDAPATVPARRAANAVPHEWLLTQGRYLVNSVMGCANCHATRLSDESVISGRELAGGPTYNLPMFKVTPRNLTPDVETGLGSWRAEDIARALTHGVRPNGVPLAPMMPSNFYKALTPEDALAVATYLQTVLPVKNPTEDPVYRQAWRVDAYPDAEKGFDAKEMAGNKLLRGAYLGALAHCLDCHTPLTDGAANFERDGGKGGRRYGKARNVAPNITSHPLRGIGAWSDGELRRALFEGVARDGRTLQYPMPWYYLVGLTSEDKDSLVAWVRSLPPRD